MRYAEVSVNSPIARGRTFSYSIPDGLSITFGQAVWVPFGDKTLQGIVVEINSLPSVAETREIQGVIDADLVVSPVGIALAGWMSRYNLDPLFDCLALLLPPGFERRVLTYLKADSSGENPAGLSSDLLAFLEIVRSNQGVSLVELQKRFGKKKSQQMVQTLSRKKLIRKVYELQKERVKPKFETFIKLKASESEATSYLQDKKRTAHKQAALLGYILSSARTIPLSEALQATATSSAIFRTLVKKGLLESQQVKVERDPLVKRSVNLAFPLSLNTAQDKAYKAICGSLEKPAPSSSSPNVFLLQGVTGSGKTEIYLQALQYSLNLGKKGIVLVPEIAMTPQIIERFVSRFPGRVAVLHSQLSLGEQFDEWWRIHNSEFDVVIGPRSALFAPQPDLGLIIIDEEHEWTYKQSETPRYHTREAALKIAELSGATLVLGSATPDVQSYFRALCKEFTLLELPERVTPGNALLPEVELIDLRQELKAGNLSIFSRSLKISIEEALKNKEQIILFLNRRGGASIVECRNCGLVIHCKRCGTPMSYHFNQEKLLCHQCNYRTPVPQVCPRCHSRYIKFLGAGTEKLEQETATLFPQARIIRWDSDVVVTEGNGHQKIFEKFRAGEADILIGTQIIAKGLDLPNVTLVGVVNADIALNLPDFRAGERTFQLLCQVVGRAGRGTSGGKAIIQTYAPENYAISAAAKQDYSGFYKKEIEYRRELRFPPYSRLARLIYQHTNENRCREETEKMKLSLQRERDNQGLGDLSFIGPAPAFIHRLRGKYRWQIVVRGSNPSAFLSTITFSKGWLIDIDPVGL